MMCVLMGLYEVDVETVRHANAREGSPTRLGRPLRTARSHIRRPRQASDGTSNNAEQGEEDGEHDVALSGAGHQKAASIFEVSTEEATTRTHAEGELDDEEGWASEDSGNGTVTSSSAVPKKKRGRSSKGKAVVKPLTGLHKKGRRRSSTSEHGRPSLQLFSDATPTLPPVATELERGLDGPEDVDRRGRTAQFERRGSGLSPRPSVQHRRLESLRVTQHSRDASPARSIRFADEPRSSGTSTPRNGMLQNETSSPISQTGYSPVDEDESAKGRLTSEHTKH